MELQLFNLTKLQNALITRVFFKKMIKTYLSPLCWKIVPCCDNVTPVGTLLFQDVVEQLEPVLQDGCAEAKQASYWESEWCLTDKVDSWISGLEAITQHSSLRALLAPTKDQASRETALWRLCLRQIVRGIAHLFYQFTDLLCTGSLALITTALGSHTIF